MKRHQPKAFVVAARRSAIGRIGGLHRLRRIEDLTAPIIAKALTDAGIALEDVDEVVLGNATAGGNPARLVALASGLGDAVPAVTIDRQCASGLEAIAQAARLIATGEARIVVAGGMESLSTAPWRVMRPRNPYLMPHFAGFDQGHGMGESRLVDAAETIAQRFQISRARQDAYAVATRRSAAAADDRKAFATEIVPLKLERNETRDESLSSFADDEELAELPVFREPDGSVTQGNAASMHDGAAICIVVSAEVMARLRKPAAVAILGAASCGAAAGEEATASIEAFRRLKTRVNGALPAKLPLVELSEASAAEAIAFRDGVGVSEDALNPEGGSLARGYPFAAASAVTAVRVFHQLTRGNGEAQQDVGVAVSGGLGGIGTAVAFERV
ncbi:MAG: thiolase family protein [Hyphomicrobiaceae bacterium]